MLTTGVYNRDREIAEQQIAEAEEAAFQKFGLVGVDRLQRQRYLHDLQVAISGIHKSH
jgi:hypothetical protein